MEDNVYQQVLKEITDLIKDESDISTETRFKIGKIVSENNKNFGSNFIENLAKTLKETGIEKMGKTTLSSMQQYYNELHSHSLLNNTYKLQWTDIRNKILGKADNDKIINELLTGQISKNSQNKIIRLTLKNIKLFEDLTIEFDKSVCIIGHNGSGKSAIVRSLALALAYRNDYLTTNEGNIIGNDFLRASEFNNYGKPINEKIGLIKVDFLVNNNLYSNEIRISKKSGGSYEFIMLKNNLIEKKDKLKILTIGFPQNRYTKNSTMAYGGNEPDVKDLKSIIFNEDSGIIKQFAKFIIENENDKNFKDVVDKIKMLIRQVIEGEFDIAQVERDESNQETLLIKTNENPEGIDLELLSDGYKDLIGWIGYFCKKMYYASNQDSNFADAPAICLIDEIDTYLHPKWQRKILPVLIDNFPNTQFIVTTHSPLIVQGQKNIIEFVGDNNHIKPLYHNENSEFSYKTVMSDYFGVDFPFSFEIEKIYKKYIELKDKLIIEKNITKEFVKIVNQLSMRSLEIEGVMRREIIQLEKLIGKKIEL